LEWRLIDSEGNPFKGFTKRELDEREITFESLGAESETTGLTPETWSKGNQSRSLSAGE
jgi:hypothetical protein